MTWYWVWLAFALGLLFGTVSHQPSKDPSHKFDMTCASISASYLIVADIRSAGIDEQEFINRMRTRLKETGKSENAYFEMVKRVEYVYNRPDMSPDEIEQTVFQRCIDGDLK